MLTQETWYGGSETVSGNKTLGLNSPRIIRLTGVTQTIILPDLTNAILEPKDYGGFRFIIIKDSAGTAIIEDADSNTIATITQNHASMVSLYQSDGTDTWGSITRTRGTPRTVGHGSRGAIQPEGEITTFDPDDIYCYVGDDCEWTNAAPLDGQDGRDLVVVPMFMNPCVTADNRLREAVRGADVIMPSDVYVNIPVGLFSEDTSHPLHQELPQTFWDALEKGNDPHKLTYKPDDKQIFANSRNPYHLRRSDSGNNWEMGLFDCVKEFWKERIEYTDGADTFHLDIVLQVEHTIIGNEPGLTGYTTDVAMDQGGKNNANDGAWGALFCLYIFTDQIAPTFSDGDMYQPAGGSVQVPFWRHDPFAWGNAPGVSGGTNADKFCHPQLMAAAMFATTMHSPCLYEWIPPNERAIIPETLLQGLHLTWEYRRPNCVPWITDPTRDIPDVCTGCSDDSGIRFNTHFSHDNSTDAWAAMTLGGDLPSSEPTTHLCWENSAGIGRTFLQPSSPGWDEEIGELTYVSDSDAGIGLCINWDDSWNEYDFDTCDGHPAEMFNDVGGTHHCFKNNETGSATQCCIAILSANATVIQSCVLDWVQYGNRVGGSCDVSSFGCDEISHITTSFAVQIYDYDLGPSTNPISLRNIEWRNYDLDPDAILWNYTYDPGDAGDIDQLVGIWTLGATITITPAGSETLTGILQYNPSRATIDGEWRDGVCSATFKNATNAVHGVGFRMEDDAGNDAYGYGGYIESTGVDTGKAVLAVYTNGVETILAQEDIVLDSDTVDANIRCHGHSIHFSWEVDGGSSGSIVVNDCTYHEDGAPALFTKGSGVLAEFENWIIIDESYQYLYHRGFLGDNNISFTVAEELLGGYGRCNEEDGSCCGECCEPECCNCISWSYTLTSVFDGSWSGPGDLLGLPYPSDPTYCGGPFWNTDCFGDWCPPNIWYCGDCPSPFPALNFCIPTRCYEDDVDSHGFHYTEDDEPNICSGLTRWYGVQVVCR